MGSGKSEAGLVVEAWRLEVGVTDTTGVTKYTYDQLSRLTALDGEYSADEAYAKHVLAWARIPGNLVEHFVAGRILERALAQGPHLFPGNECSKTNANVANVEQGSKEGPG